MTGTRARQRLQFLAAGNVLGQTARIFDQVFDPFSNPGSGFIFTELHLCECMCVSVSKSVLMEPEELYLSSWNYYRLFEQKSTASRCKGLVELSGRIHVTLKSI